MLLLLLLLPLPLSVMTAVILRLPALPLFFWLSSRRDLLLPCAFAFPLQLPEVSEEANESPANSQLHAYQPHPRPWNALDAPRRSRSHPPLQRLAAPGPKPTSRPPPLRHSLRPNLHRRHRLARPPRSRPATSLRLPPPHRRAHTPNPPPPQASPSPPPSNPPRNPNHHHRKPTQPPPTAPTKQNSAASSSSAPPANPPSRCSPSSTTASPTTPPPSSAKPPSNNARSPSSASASGSAPPKHSLQLFSLPRGSLLYNSRSLLGLFHTHPRHRSSAAPQPTSLSAARCDEAARQDLATTLGQGITDADGRCKTLLGDHPFEATTYRIRFDTAPVLRRTEIASLYPYSKSSSPSPTPPSTTTSLCCSPPTATPPTEAADR